MPLYAHLKIVVVFSFNFLTFRAHNRKETRHASCALCLDRVALLFW